jgi:hypothetical protein
LNIRHSLAMRLSLACLLATCLLLAFPAAAPAAPAPFDLAGPVLDVKISRGATTLPAAAVPNLAVGDRVWIKADLPSSQSAHYLLVAAFLRGATNPPPEDWFFPCKTWTGKCAAAGLTVTVPEGAQQVLVFLAPQTSGDFKTLRSAVRGRPGAFVRTSQDLNQAALDRSRLERYLTTIRTMNDSDPAKLAQVAPLLARSLAIKVDEKCLDRLPELQAPCLMQGQEALILNDGHSTSIVEALTSGPGSDLAMEASYTPQLSYGYYSPYVASVLDIARIFDSFRTAQYQYIPALAAQRGDKLALTLNAAPSFHNPQSVLVTALPAVKAAQLPPLHAVDPAEIYCARRSLLVLPVEGAPLVFSTGFAHDVTLNLAGADGESLDLPATPDAAQGGYVIDTAALGARKLGERVQASLHGFWGFDPYQGPRFELMNAHARTWELAAGDESALIIGRQDTVHLRADSVRCIDGIMLKDPAGKQLKVDWKSVKPDEVEVKLPLQEAQPGTLTLLVRQYGVTDPEPVTLQAFSEAGRFDGFHLHAGDSSGTLKGSRLDEVASLKLKNVTFLPGELSTRAGNDELPMTAADAQAAFALKAEHGNALLTLKDGRSLNVAAAIDAPRPRVSLIGKTVQPAAAADDGAIQLSDAGELPQDGVLKFSIRAESPRSLSADEKLEVATTDESWSTTLTVGNGGFTLETAQVAVATLNPAKAFGPSAFGPLKFRVEAKGVTSDWQALATLVRLPVLKAIQCPATPELACQLSGTNLFLIESVAADAESTHAVTVPDGFLGSTLPVPHPTAGVLYIKLRDNPGVINPALLTALQLPASAVGANGSAERQSSVRTDKPPTITAPATAAPTAPTPIPTAAPPSATASTTTPTAAAPTAAAQAAPPPTAATPTLNTTPIPTAAPPSATAPTAAPTAAPTQTPTATAPNPAAQAAAAQAAP